MCYFLVSIPRFVKPIFCLEWVFWLCKEFSNRIHSVTLRGEKESEKYPVKCSGGAKESEKYPVKCSAGTKESEKYPVKCSAGTKLVQSC